MQASKTSPEIRKINVGSELKLNIWETRVRSFLLNVRSIQQSFRAYLSLRTYRELFRDRQWAFYIQVSEGWEAWPPRASRSKVLTIYTPEGRINYLLCNCVVSNGLVHRVGFVI